MVGLATPDCWTKPFVQVSANEHLLQTSRFLSLPAVTVLRQQSRRTLHTLPERKMRKVADGHT